MFVPLIGNTARNAARYAPQIPPSSFSRVPASRVGCKTPFRSINTTLTAGTGHQTSKTTLSIGEVATFGAMFTTLAAAVFANIKLVIDMENNNDGNTVTGLQEKPNPFNPDYVADDLTDRESIRSLHSTKFVDHRNTVHFDENKASFLQAFHRDNIPEYKKIVSNSSLLDVLVRCRDTSIGFISAGLVDMEAKILHRSNLQMACMMAAKDINNAGESPTYIVLSSDMDNSMTCIQKLCHANLDNPIKFKFLVNYGKHSGIIDFKIEKGRLSAVIIDSFGTENVEANNFQYSKYVAESLEYVARNAKQLNIPCDIFIARNRIQGDSELCDFINVALVDALNKMTPDIHDYCRENSIKNTHDQYLVSAKNQQYNALVNAFDLPLSFEPLALTQSLTRITKFYERASSKEQSQQAAAGITDAQTFVQKHAVIENKKNQRAIHEFEEFYPAWDKNINTSDDLECLYKKASQYNGLQFKEDIMKKYKIAFNDNDKEPLKIADSFTKNGRLRNISGSANTFAPCAGDDTVHKPL